MNYREILIKIHAAKTHEELDTVHRKYIYEIECSEELQKQIYKKRRYITNQIEKL
jgi:hypothetical protein